MFGKNLEGGAWRTAVRQGRPSATALTLTSLPDGAYRFRVAAINDAGRGPYSSPTDTVRVETLGEPGAVGLKSLKGKRVKAKWLAVSAADDRASTLWR